MKVAPSIETARNLPLEEVNQRSWRLRSDEDYDGSRGVAVLAAEADWHRPGERDHDGEVSRHLQVWEWCDGDGEAGGRVPGLGQEDEALRRGLPRAGTSDTARGATLLGGVGR
eukprot:9469813-Pyramimonas_sp.AAC.1